MRFSRLGPVALVIGALVSGCADSKQCPAPQPQDDLCGSGYFVRFDPSDADDAYRPFPNPLRTTKQPFKSRTTGYSPNYPGAFGPLLDTLDGFGTYSPILVAFNDLIDPVNLPQTPEASLDPSAPLYILDLEAIRADPNASFASVVQASTSWYDGTQADVPVNTLVIAPYSPLAPKHEFAVVVTDRLKTWTDPLHQSPQKCVGPAPRFNCVKAKGVVDKTLEPMRSGLQPLFTWLEEQGIARGDVSMALNFTTESVEDELVDIHDQVNTAAPPDPELDPTRLFTNVSNPTTHKLVPAVKAYFQNLTSGVSVNFDDYDFSAMGTIAYGFFDSIDYRQPTFKLFITDGTTGHVQPQDVNRLEFMMVLPKADPANGIAPPYKTVVFQHALTVCKETMVAIGNEFNKRGIALVGIDVVNHGSRAQDYLDGTASRHCTIDALDFLTVNNPLELRESFRQTVADQFQFVDMVSVLNTDVDGDGVKDLDTTRMGYVSQSLGSIIGGTFMAMEPKVGAGVLNVGGGGLYSVALSFFGDQGGAPVGPDGFARLPTSFLDLFTILQNTVERADPINYARFIAREPLTFKGVKSPPKSILLQEAVGDDTVGNYSTDALTREMGGELAGPTTFRTVPGIALHDAPFAGNAANGQATIAQTQFDPAGHPFLLEMDNPGALCRGQIQAAIFADTYLRNGVATVIDAYSDPAVAGCPP